MICFSHLGATCLEREHWEESIYIISVWFRRGLHYLIEKCALTYWHWDSRQGLKCECVNTLLNHRKVDHRSLCNLTSRQIAVLKLPCPGCRSVYYGQYRCSGPGANETGRVAWSHELTDWEAAPFLSLSFVDGEAWVPQSLRPLAWRPSSSYLVS